MNKRTIWFEAEFDLILINNEKAKIKIIHNIDDMILAALDNWLVRTEIFTAESFCQYINGKRERGLSDHYAYTHAQFKEYLLKNNPFGNKPKRSKHRRTRESNINQKVHS
jgi:hypothetical protein